MCLAVPGQIVEIVDRELRLATVEVAGVRRTINVGLIDGDAAPTAGEWVLVHVGFALARVDEDEARATLALLRQLGTELDREIEDFERSSIE
jgi:hydrogenase expression/formation protein HypC